MCAGSSGKAHTKPAAAPHADPLAPFSAAVAAAVARPVAVSAPKMQVSALKYKETYVPVTGGVGLFMGSTSICQASVWGLCGG